MKGASKVTDRIGLPWRVSAKWFNNRLNCTYEGITAPGGCGGCCDDPRVKDWWPPNDPKTGYCPYLGSDGCVLGIEDRPIGCLLTPFTVREKDGVRRLLVYWRNTFTICKGMWGKGPRLVEAFEDILTHLFGGEGYAKILAGCDRGEDVVVYMDPHHEKVFILEEHECREGVVPVPRTERVLPDDILNLPVHERGGLGLIGELFEP